MLAMRLAEKYIGSFHSAGGQGHPKNDLLMLAQLCVDAQRVKREKQRLKVRHSDRAVAEALIKKRDWQCYSLKTLQNLPPAARYRISRQL